MAWWEMEGFAVETDQVGRFKKPVLRVVKILI